MSFSEIYGPLSEAGKNGSCCPSFYCCYCWDSCLSRLKALLLAHLYIPYFNFMSAISRPASTDLLGVTSGLLILYVWLNHNIWLYAALFLALASSLSPRLGLLVQDVWSRLVHTLAWLNSRILLSIVYLLMLTPLAWLYRLRKSDPHFLHQKAESYFHIMEKQYGKHDLEMIG